MSTPLLPWEVLERIIGHSGDHPQTLRNFSLTCRDLRPRALCLLVADVCLNNRGKTFDFCDFLQASPHLKPFVRSVALNPKDFAPFPLFSVLSNLSQVKFTLTQPIKPQIRAVTDLNRCSLTCCKVFGTHIQALHLSHLSFSTYFDFARVLLTFTTLTNLVCTGVVIISEGNKASLSVLERRLSKRLHLRTVSLPVCCRHEESWLKP